jgi:hypothetical protein
MKETDLGFRYRIVESLIEIYYQNKLIQKLNKDKNEKLINDLSLSNFNEQQLILAKITGNFKRGNERKAKNHYRNKNY